MHQLSRPIFFICFFLAAYVLSNPVKLEKRSFIYRQVRRVRPFQSATAGKAALRQAYNKYNFNLPSSFGAGKIKAALNPSASNNSIGSLASNAPDDTGTVSAHPEQNAAEYLSPVNIGGQQLVLNFDSGSSDLWVFSTNLPASTIGGHTAFDPSKSTTYKPLDGATWQISYGDGSHAAGIVGYDTVEVGGATVTRQAVELATSVSSSFASDTNNDGIVGLGFSALNTVKPNQQQTFFENLMPTLKLPVFSVDLNNDTSGTYAFGIIDDTKYKGELHDVPIDVKSGFWEVSSDSFQVGDKVITNKGASPAIADTGTSLILVDPQVAETYYSQVIGSKVDNSIGGYVYPCSSTLPDFGVTLGDYMAMVPGNQVTFAQVDSQTCFGGVQTNSGSSLQIYGGVLFRAQYVVFNGGTKSIQLAPKD